MHKISLGKKTTFYTGYLSKYTVEYFPQTHFYCLVLDEEKDKEMLLYFSSSGKATIESEEKFVLVRCNKKILNE